MVNFSKDTVQHPLPPGERKSCPKKEEYFVLLSPWADFSAGTVVARREGAKPLYGVVEGHYPFGVGTYDISDEYLGPAHAEEVLDAVQDLARPKGGIFWDAKQAKQQAEQVIHLFKE